MTGLIGPGGQPLGQQPVVAHIIEIDGSPGPEGIRAVAAYWQQQLGVPAIILTGGVHVVAAVLADGQLQEVALDPELSVRVKSLLDQRAAREPEGHG